MTTSQTKGIEKLATESAELARKSLRKRNELEAYLGLLDYRAGWVREIKSVHNYFRTLRSA
jgi:hypothetical protein